MTRTWLITWTTYGTWLPGDARGFVSEVRDDAGKKVIHNQYGTACDQGNPALKAAMAELLDGEPTWLSREQAEAVGGQIRETATYRNWRLMAVAVMANHAHVLVRTPEAVDEDAILRDLKAYASRALNRLSGKKTAGRWWTDRGSTRRKEGERAIRAAFEYVQNQPGALYVWVDGGSLADL